MIILARILKVFAGFIIFFSILIYIIYILASDHLNQKINIEKELVFYIDDGETITSTIKKLYKDHLILQNLRFTVLSLRLLHPHITFKTGEYLLQKDQTLASIINKFDKGEVVVHKVTVVEGQTVLSVKNMLETRNNLSGRIITNVEEGYLFPDTYFYTYGQDRDELFKRMNNSMNQKLEKIWNKNHRVLKNIQELVILASIVEKESSIPAERPKVAAVFLNRLTKRMRMQADPTIIYAISKLGYIDRSLTLKDLNIDSPYNTYKYAGLPPTAIAIPSIDSIEAVMNDITSDYLYFVANPYGTHCFSDNLDSHNKNVINYRSRNLNSSCE